jgi:hypothetical protein
MVFTPLDKTIRLSSRYISLTSVSAACKLRLADAGAVIGRQQLSGLFKSC